MFSYLFLGRAAADMIINNANFENFEFSPNDIYIFAFGYEHRSYYLYDKLTKRFPSISPVVFVLDDYEKYAHTSAKVREVQAQSYAIYYNSYEDAKGFQEKVLQIINSKLPESEKIRVHIDYSSMPRSWYCKLPMLLENILRENDAVCFWYTEGKYPPTYEEYPSAGIESFPLFSGKPSLQIDSNRIHILGLGYDIIRSEAILSITDPNYLIACYAYNPNREGFLDSLKSVNSPILSRAAMTLSLHINDFAFMVSKLCETANELLPIGDIILIPDGPKPLIFAISLVPNLLNKSGITCLHISRNAEYFEPVDVEATGVTHGFLISIA